MKRSVEWCRGRIDGIKHVADYMWDSRWSWPARVQVELDVMERLLAEAEASEASVPTAAEVIAAAERALAPICKNADEAERLLNEGWVEKHQCIANKLQFGDVIMAKDALAIIAKWKEAHRG